MNRRKLRKHATVSERHAAHPPRVEALRGEAEMRSDNVLADRVDQRRMLCGYGSHAPVYQHSVYTSRGQSLIGIAAALMHKLRVAHDPAFGARLLRLIEASEFKNRRQFGIRAMGWPPGSAAQRMQHYVDGRIPDVETLLRVAEALRVTVADLLDLPEASAAADEGLRGILRHLLELEDIPGDKADTIANVALEAQRLLRAFPDEEPLPTRAKFAARAAWHQQRPPAHGM